MVKNEGGYAPLQIFMGRFNRPISYIEDKVVLFRTTLSLKEGDYVLPLKIEDRGNYFLCSRFIKSPFFYDGDFYYNSKDGDGDNLISIDDIDYEITEEDKILAVVLEITESVVNAEGVKTSRMRTEKILVKYVVGDTEWQEERSADREEIEFEFRIAVGKKWKKFSSILSKILEESAVKEVIEEVEAKKRTEEEKKQEVERKWKEYKNTLEKFSKAYEKYLEDFRNSEYKVLSLDKKVVSHSKWKGDLVVTEETEVITADVEIKVRRETLREAVRVERIIVNRKMTEEEVETEIKRKVNRIIRKKLRTEEVVIGEWIAEAERTGMTEMKETVMKVVAGEIPFWEASSRMEDLREEIGG